MTEHPALKALLDGRALFHRLPTGQAHSHGLQPFVLTFLHAHLWKGARTLETGAGLSTIIFALKGCMHTCITPAGDEVDRIRSFCASYGVGLDHMEFLVERSQHVLPQLREADWDLVLIDGDHSFPVSFIDFYYAAIGLRIGGVLVIDDTNLWTCNSMRAFLLKSPDWELVREFPRTCVFVKKGEVRFEDDWPIQDFIESRALAVRTKLRMAVFLLRRGEIRELLKKGGNALLGKNASS